jgi:tRNA (guanine-N7-)-methyltransferase
MTGTAEQTAPGTAPERGVERVLYGRRKGRPLRPGQQALVDRLLPRIEIAPPPPGAAVDPRSLFDFTPTAAWLEVGFGAGEHLAAQARANSSIAMIGCEPFLNGVARLLTAIDRDGLGNIRIFRDDARLLLAALTPGCIQRAFVLFPDPWPKARHHKRRFVSPDNIARLARVLSDGAELRVATDDPGYQTWILEHTLAADNFEWLAGRATDWRVRPADWPATRYETKAIASGRSCAYFRFRRRPRQH